MSNYENVQTIQFGSQQSQAPAPQYQPNIGGVSTYQASPVPSENSYTSSSVQTGLGNVVTIGATGTQSAGMQTVSTADLAGNGNDFLATARNAGMPALGNLTPDSVVKFGGMEVDLATLEMMGEVRRTATGYEVAGANGGGTQQEAQSNSLPKGVELFDAVTEARVAGAVGTIPQAMLDSAMAHVLENGVDGLNFSDLARHSGITPTEARQRVEMLAGAFSQQADNIAKASGIDNPADLWDWASTERKEAFANARREMAFGRNTQALRALVGEYYRSMPPAAGALQKAGFPVRTDGSGEQLVQIRGMWMTAETAAAAGLI